MTAADESPDEMLRRDRNGAVGTAAAFMRLALRDCSESPRSGVYMMQTAISGLHGNTGEIYSAMSDHVT